MSETNAPSWFPVLTLIIGYLLKYVTDWIQHRLTAQRDREARNAARQAVLFDRRNNFQRETILSLQETLAALGRCMGAMHHLDVMAHRSTGKWQKHLYPDELDERARIAQVDASMLQVRVRDPQIREGADRLKGLAVKVTMPASREEAERNMLAFAREHETINGRIGEILRHLDDEAIS